MKPKHLVIGGVISTLIGCLLFYDSVVVLLLYLMFGSGERPIPGFDVKEFLIGAAFLGVGIVTLIRQRGDTPNQYSLPIGLVIVGMFAPLLLQLEIHGPWWFTSNSDVTIMSGGMYGDEIIVRDRYVRYEDDYGLMPAPEQPLPMIADESTLEKVPDDLFPSPEAIPIEKAIEAPPPAPSLSMEEPDLKYEQDLSDACGDEDTYDPTADALVDQGINALSQQGNADRAERLFREALAMEPRHLVAYNRLGWMLVNVRNDASAAVDLLSDAVTLFPECDWVHYDLGNAYSTVGNYDAARTELTWAISYASDPAPSYYYNLGNAHLNDGMPAEAVAYYETALQMDPVHSGAEINLVHAYIRTQQSDKLLARFYDNADYLRRIGISYGEQHGDAGAIQFFKRSVELEEDADTHYNLAVAYGKMRNFSAAERHAKRALAIEPNHDGAKVALRLSRNQ